MTLEDHFQTMMRGAYPAARPPVHVVQQLRRSFMSGAMSFLAIVTELPDDTTVEDAAMQAIRGEVARFAANVGTRAEPEDYSDE